MDSNDVMIDNLCSQGYHVIDNFLSQEQYTQLLDLAEELYQQGAFKPAKIGVTLASQLQKTIRNDHIFWLDELMDKPIVQLYLQRMSELATLFNHHLYLGLNELECHFARYQPGSFYKKHVDQFVSKKTRKISCVYYLNNHWEPSYGGFLKLYSLDNTPMTEIMPIANRLICFNSELPHEVAKTRQQRISIASWIKSNPG